MAFGPFVLVPPAEPPACSPFNSGGCSRLARCARINPSSFCGAVSYQGPIYGHGEGPAPIPPQGMLVQPEMHIPHPGESTSAPLSRCCSDCSSSRVSSGLHPHQSGGPIADPALYGGPAVSLSPGQPQQLLPPPFYPPPGVMTFPYPTMYPSPQVSLGSPPLRPGRRRLAHLTLLCSRVSPR